MRNRIAFHTLATAPIILQCSKVKEFDPTIASLTTARASEAKQQQDMLETELATLAKAAK